VGEIALIECRDNPSDSNLQEVINWHVPWRQKQARVLVPVSSAEHVLAVPDNSHGDSV